MYLNKAMIIGNLTRDPELRSLPSGVQVATFGVATNRQYKDKDGARQEATEFHNVVVFGRQAETSAQYLSKGNTVLVEGRLQTRTWESDGQKKNRTEIVAERVQFGPKGGASASGSEPGSGSGKEKSSGGKQAKEGEENIDYPQEDINPEDIPF